jgi:hypothetical protein
MQTVHQAGHFIGRILVQESEKTACSRNYQHPLDRFEDCDRVQSCRRRASTNHTGPLPCKPSYTRINIGVRTLYDWRVLPEFKAAVAKHRKAWEQTVFERGVANKANRVNTMNALTC